MTTKTAYRFNRTYESVLQATPQEVWDFHADASALKVLTPPHNRVELVGDDLAVRDGALHVLRVRPFGFALEWRARISEVDPPNGFVDTAEKSPFKAWRHRHRFLAHQDGCLLRDEVEYDLPGGPLAGLVDRLLVGRQLDAMFAYRHAATRKALEARLGPSATLET
jgi:ligand-binding SRPBCC domain-containing protein